MRFVLLSTEQQAQSASARAAAEQHEQELHSLRAEAAQASFVRRVYCWPLNTKSLEMLFCQQLMVT